MSKLKYCIVLILPVLAGIAFLTTGVSTLLPALFFFGVVPAVELILKPDHQNKSEPEKMTLAHEAFFNWFLYLLVLILLSVLVLFVSTISDPGLTASNFIGRIISMGMMCGVAINLGHELGHRSNRMEQLLGEIALLISLENQFLPYHNYCHHKNVATPQDPATARRNESVYRFWIRSQIGSYIQAWQVEIHNQRRKHRHPFSVHNRMVGYTIAQICLLLSLYFRFGLKTMLAFIAAAIIGKLILESVNYIEHYGLTRRVKADGKYERVLPVHSWNSDHLFGRSLMFELPRHSDHHFKANKPYQTLDSFPESPHLPTGYPGMMILALFPPLWFWLMNSKIDELNISLECGDLSPLSHKPTCRQVTATSR
ncbi:MAG: alkane 1-monooxygenase [Acidobacteria bacterium]|nr:alkane 1-monooxygenase [Acidobacteriota bacterium]